MSEEVRQFLEIVRNVAMKPRTGNQRKFYVRSFCQGCGEITAHGCTEQGEWEERRCEMCGWTASYRVR